MFASDRIFLKTIEDSVQGSRKVSAKAVQGYAEFCFMVHHWSLFWILACGSTIITDDVGGAIASPRYPYTYPPNQNCSWIIQAQEPCKSAIISRYLCWRLWSCIFSYKWFPCISLNAAGFVVFQSTMSLCPSPTLRWRWCLETAHMIVWRSWMETIMIPHLLV